MTEPETTSRSVEDLVREICEIEAAIAKLAEPAPATDHWPQEIDGPTEIDGPEEIDPELVDLVLREYDAVRALRLRLVRP